MSSRTKKMLQMLDVKTSTSCHESRTDQQDNLQISNQDNTEKVASWLRPSQPLNKKTSTEASSSPNITIMRHGGKLTVISPSNVKKYRVTQNSLIQETEECQDAIFPPIVGIDSLQVTPKKPVKSVARNLFGSCSNLMDNNFCEQERETKNSKLNAKEDNRGSSSLLSMRELSIRVTPNIFPSRYSDQDTSSSSEPLSPDYWEYLPEKRSDSSESDYSYPSSRANNSVSAPESVCFEEDKLELNSNKPKNNKKRSLVSNKNKKPGKTTRVADLCYYCETEVHNFARHIIKNHSQEIEVQKIICLKPKDLTRRRLIEAVRKRGNHLKNMNTCVKPVKKSHVLGRIVKSCIPCKHCYGYFRPKQLWRHIKRCPLNPGCKTKYSHKTDAQDLLIANKFVDQKLKSTVFPTMRADKVSLAVKQDSLICRYGAQYLTSHRERHHINVCSRKMRELARLLIEIKKLHPTIKNLFEALSPIYFDSFVEATKTVAGYDVLNQEYKSSTFAMNIATSLKECCSLAIRVALKSKVSESSISTAELETNFRFFQQLLKDSWRFEISTIASACLNTRKWNKITIVPLASDLKIFKTYLLENAKRAEHKLKINPNNKEAYKLLIEVSYCRSMLLNRKRGGELQRMLLRVYQNAQTHQSYEEFNDAITPAEKFLMSQFKRVVIRGKRHRGVPVLFSKDVQKNLEILIALRANFVNESNMYLFPTLQSETPIVGYKVIQKHAILSGVRNPAALTSTRLRKHLATMSQVLELSQNDIEQLANFMGHTKDVHREVYRLPDDVYQTAKITKLLILMENGKAGQYKGKSLNEININMDDELMEEESDREYINEEIFEDEPSPLAVPAKSKRILVPWTAEQKKILNSHFRKNIQNKIALRKGDCDELKYIYPEIFHNKTWAQIKVYIQNMYSKN